MKHFYLVENSRRGKLPGVPELIEEYITNRGADIKRAADRYDADDIPEDTECLIVMGGDGTMMRVAGITAGRDIPIIGINVGNLGYLTSASSREEIIPMIDKLLNGEYTIENHSMISGSWSDAGGSHTAYAFNDINIDRRASRAIRMRISVNGELLNEYLADGIIISTPAGSTAYNLAAGGPIVEPCSDVMVITPVSPHAFMARSVVLGMNNRVDVTVAGGNGEEREFAEVACDGQSMGSISEETTVTFSKAEYTIPMIRLSGDSYFKTLRNKMNQIRG